MHAVAAILIISGKLGLCGASTFFSAVNREFLLELLVEL